MAFLRRLFTARVGPDLCGAAVIQPVMTTVGVFTFLAGALYLPSLGPTRVEMIILLLLLAAIALLCHAVGQLAAVLDAGMVGPTSPPDRPLQPATESLASAFCRLRLRAGGQN